MIERYVWSCAFGLVAGTLFALLFSCATPAPPLGDLAKALVHCQEVGDTAPDGGQLAAYEACVDAGLP